MGSVACGVFAKREMEVEGKGEVGWGWCSARWKGEGARLP